MRLTFTTVAAVCLGAVAAGCGAPETSAAAVQSADPVRCDAYASPGAGTAQRLADSLRPGQTGCLRGGHYSGTGYDGYVLRVARGGRGGAPIRIASAPGERARLRGIVYLVEGADHVTLSNLTLDGRHPSRPSGSQLSIQIMAHDVTIEGSEITNRGLRSCVIIGNEARRPVLRDNVFRDCGDPGNRMLDHAIYVASSRRARIVRNVFLRSGGWAVHLYPSAQRSKVTGNVMLDNGGGVIFGGDSQRASNRNLVVGNVIGGSRERPEISSSFGGPRGRGNVVRDNCLSPGLRPSDPEWGFRAWGNRIASGGACLDTASMGLVSVLQGVAPALVARLSRR